MSHCYDIVLDSQLGKRFGTLCLTQAGDCVTGSISLMGKDNPVTGKRHEQRVELFHELRTAVSVLECRTVLELSGDSLHGCVMSEGSRMELNGKSVPGGAAEKEHA